MPGRPADRRRGETREARWPCRKHKLIAPKKKRSERHRMGFCTKKRRPADGRATALSKNPTLAVHAAAMLATLAALTTLSGLVLATLMLLTGLSLSALLLLAGLLLTALLR